MTIQKICDYLNIVLNNNNMSNIKKVVLKLIDFYGQYEFFLF